MDLRERFANLTETLQHLESVPPDPDAYNGRHVGKRATTIRRVKRLAPAERAELVADYHSGLSVYQLADKYSIHRHTVSTHLRVAGVRLRLDSLTTEQVDHVVQLYQSGLSLAMVADRFGVYPQTILAHLKRRGIPRRDTHGRTR